MGITPLRLIQRLQKWYSASSPKPVDSTPAEAIPVSEHDYRRLLERLSAQISKDAITQLPTYEDPSRTVMVVDDNNLHEAIASLANERYLGFDTESRPTFKKMEARHKIALVQLSSARHCCLFQMAKITDPSPLQALTQNPQIIKLGIGLKDDINYLFNDYGLTVNHAGDIGTLLKLLGRKDMIGSRQLVAVTLNTRLRKSRSATTSNWSNSQLTPSQISYASDDAFSSVDAYLELQKLLRPYQVLLPQPALKLLDFED